MPNQFTTSLWGDEAFSAILSQKPIFEIVATIARDTSPPLYNLTEHLWFAAFGSSEIAIRSLSFVYYLIAIFFTYKIARHFWSRNSALLASILTFLNPFFFIYAFEGRMYSILAAAVVASMYFFITKKWVGYVIATVAALYSHHFAIFALFIQGLWSLTWLIQKKPKTFFSYIKACIAIVILYAPWLIPLYNQTKMVGSGFWLGTPTPEDLKTLIQKYMAQGQTHMLSDLALWVSIAILVLRKWHKDMGKSAFLLLWFLGPIVTVFAISQKFQSIFYDRYLLYAIPAFAIILTSQRRRLSSLLVGILIAMFLVIDIFYFTHPTKRPFAQLANYVLETKRGDDVLLNWNSGAHHLWESKYYKIPAPIYVPSGNLPYFVGTALMGPEDIITKLPAAKSFKDPYRVGVITSGPVEEIVIPGYTATDTKQFGDLKFVWQERQR